MDSNANLSELLNLSARIFTFMSIDVAGSTQIKNGQNEQDIIYTFLAYHKLVSGLAYTHHGEVATISGDGIMCRFQRPDDAAQMAEAVLDQLADFNKKQNHLTKPLTLRLGVHTGEVLQSESMTSGQIISKTLDITAKLQQGATANTVLFSEATIAQLGEKGKKYQRKGWNAPLGIHVFEFAAQGATAVQALRKMPEPARILIVEPEIDEINKLKKTLFGSRFEMFSVFSHKQATLAMGSWSPHLVISSLDMDWKSGWELLSSVREDAKMSETPIIVMSSQTSGETIQRSMKIGANGFLRKPLDVQQITKRVEIVMREFYL
jgi:class 3 adenylate cyclase